MGTSPDILILIFRGFPFASSRFLLQKKRLPSLKTMNVL
jgi:hypothetical protein